MITPAARRGAFTLIEALVAMASVGSIGLAIFATLYMGTILFSKNVCMNVSHEIARNALMHLQEDIHQAASLPQLTDSNEVALSSTSTGPAAGISFQVVMSGTTRCQVLANAAVGSNQVQIGFSSTMPPPNANERLIIPYYDLEKDINSVTISGTTATLTLSGTIGTAVTPTILLQSFNIPCFLTQRVTYYVTGGPTASNPTAPYMLNYDGVGTRRSYPLSYLAACATPFGLPDPTLGNIYSQFVVSANLYGQSPQFTNRGYKSADILITGQISPYSQVTKFQ